jgi:deoxyribose-phosphate aldolase
MNPSPDRNSARQARELAARIQHTLISNRVTRAQWEQHIADCLRYRFHAAMVPAAWVRGTAEELHGSGIVVASWIDMPFGTMTSRGKAREAGILVEEGAEEVDLMPNVGLLLSGMEGAYRDDIRGVVEAAAGRPVKVMLEMPLLDATQIERAVALAVEAGAAFLKNLSSGAVGPATPDQIRLLRRLAPSRVRIKASGNIKTARQVRELVAAGAELVGSSSGVAIVHEVLGEDAPASSTQDAY